MENHCMFVYKTKGSGHGRLEMNVPFPPTIVDVTNAEVKIAKELDVPVSKIIICNVFPIKGVK